MVIVLFAGLLAQKKFCPDSSNNSAEDDETKIKQYLGAIYWKEEAAKPKARDYLKQEAERLVDAFWPAITKVAETLWAKDCTPVTEDWGTKLPREKAVGASVIAEILKEWKISCSVDDCAVDDPAATVED
jgi:hypothetical protein